MKLIAIFIAFVLAFLVGQIIVLRLYLFSFRRRLFDPVDSRKAHIGLIPRLGGMAFLPTQCAVFMLTLVVLRHFEVINVDYVLLCRFLLLMCGLGLLYAVGVIDDLKDISYKWKFTIQIVAASFLPLSGLWIGNLGGLLGITVMPSWIGIALTVLIVVFVINAFNLIDGIDGLCSGLTIVACTVLGTLFFMRGSWLQVIFSFITVGVLAPFFYYNVFGRTKRRRRIFMGDTGSTTLGLTVSFLAISYAAEVPGPDYSMGSNIMLAFSVLLVPVLDVVRVIFIRLFTRKSLFVPDKNHAHHYFMAMGYSKHTTLFYMLMIALGFIVLNMYLFRFAKMDNNLVLLLDVALWFAGLWLFGKVKRNGMKNREQV